MFSPVHVAALFTQATKTLERSVIMLQERTPSDAVEDYDLDTYFVSEDVIGSCGMPGRKAMTEPAPLLTNSSGCYTATPLEWVSAVQALVRVANIRTYLEATAVLAARLKREATAASSGVSRKRQQGQNFPILKQIVSGLGSLEVIWGNKDAFPDVQSLWWDPVACEAVTLRAGVDPEQFSMDCGACIIGLKIACALTTDAVYCCDRLLRELKDWGRRTKEDAKMAETVTGVSYRQRSEVVILVSEALVHLPTEAAEWTMERITQVLVDAVPVTITSGQKPLNVGIFLIPGWAAHVLLQSSNIRSPINGGTLDSVARLAREMVPLCLENDSRFRDYCAETVRFIGIVSEQLVQRAVFRELDDEISATTTSTQHTSIALRLMFDTFLQPLEQSFTRAVPQPGVSNSLWNVLVRPFHCFVLTRSLSLISLSSERASAVTRVCSAILRTALYRLVVIVETLGAAELNNLNGTLQRAHQQKRYKGMLHHSHGRITANLLNAIAEDRQLLLEDANMCSESGHRILKLHDGMDNKDGDHVMFLYLDGGVIHYASGGKDRKFSVAKSVEEVFKKL